MMNGFILLLNVMVKIPIRLPDGTFREVDCLLDTGFTGEMVLPAQEVVTLQLPFSRETQADLADGSQVHVSIYKGYVRWHDDERSIKVLVTGDRPLIGLGLLEGTALYAEFISNGKVTLQEVARADT